uniref:Protein UNC80 C-terminal domain-containing protein n=1 Tax=Parascaris equorum TaxID=6256 RepID=A0A914R9U8_PAREQ
MQATLPYFVEWAERETIRQNNSSAAVKHELTVYSTVCVEMKALVNCCDILARGPTRTFDIVNSVSDRGKSFIADSPQFFDPPTKLSEIALSLLKVAPYDLNTMACLGLQK